MAEHLAGKAIPANGVGEGMGFFGVLIHRHTYQNVVYLMLSFPLGIFYFVIVVTGFSLGIGLAILGVGLLILMLMMAAMRGFAALERQLAGWLFEVEIPPPDAGPDPWHHPLQALRKYAGDPYTWRVLAYLLLKFPFGIFAFVVLITLIALTASLVLAPLLYTLVPFDIMSHRVATAEEALACLGLGLLVGFLSAHVVNGLAALWRSLAIHMLAGGAPARRPELRRGPVVIP